MLNIESKYSSHMNQISMCNFQVLTIVYIMQFIMTSL